MADDSNKAGKSDGSPSSVPVKDSAPVSNQVPPTGTSDVTTSSSPVPQVQPPSKPDTVQGEASACNSMGISPFSTWHPSCATVPSASGPFYENWDDPPQNGWQAPIYGQYQPNQQDNSTWQFASSSQGPSQGSGCGSNYGSGFGGYASASPVPSPRTMSRQEWQQQNQPPVPRGVSMNVLEGSNNPGTSAPRRPSQLSSSSQSPSVPNPGERLYPSIGAADLDPLNRGNGTGMLYDPFRPVPRAPIADPNHPLPSGGAPPNARFDPIGTPPPKGGGKFKAPPPNTDHFPPPGSPDPYL